MKQPRFTWDLYSLFNSRHTSRKSCPCDGYQSDIYSCHPEEFCIFSFLLETDETHNSAMVDAILVQNKTKLFVCVTKLQSLRITLRFFHFMLTVKRCYASLLPSTSPSTFRHNSSINARLQTATRPAIEPRPKGGPYNPVSVWASDETKPRFYVGDGRPSRVTRLVNPLPTSVRQRSDLCNVTTDRHLGPSQTTLCHDVAILSGGNSAVDTFSRASPRTVS